jgi:hypothetical protein
MLLDYMPAYYRDSKVLIALLRAFTEEINENSRTISELESQLYVDTATWGLDVWERQFGIYTDLSKPHQERREAIKAKMRGFGTCTIEMIKNTALAYTNTEVEVIEDNATYTFVVKFANVKGVPSNEGAFKKTIDTIKPAHLAYTMEYTYTTWGELKAKLWGELKTKTWGQVKTI